MQDDLMAFLHKRASRCQAKSVSRARDENFLHVAFQIAHVWDDRDYGWQETMVDLAICTVRQ